MVKKLFKHEFAAFWRTLLPVYAVLLGIALLGRLIQLFENNSTVYDIVNGSSIFVYAIAVLVCFGFATVFGIVRFYKNLFTGEGYLSFTLPVTPAQHILVKICTAVAFEVLSLVAVTLSACIMTAGDVLSEVVKAGVYLFNAIPAEYKVHIIFYGIELLAVLLVAAAGSLLLYYACIAIGQTFRKNRVLGAVAVYFIFYMATQVVATVLTVCFSVFYEYLPLQQISQFAQDHTTTFIHLLLCGIVLVSVLLAAVYFLVIRGIIHRKLNLE